MSRPLDHCYGREFPTKKHKVKKDEVRSATAHGKPAANNTQVTEKEADNSETEDATKKQKMTWVHIIATMIN